MLKQLKKAFCDYRHERETAFTQHSTQIISSFNDAVKRYKRQQRREKFNRILDTIGNFLFPQPVYATAH